MKIQTTVPPSDNELVARVQQGSDAAFNELIRRYQPSIKCRIKRVLSLSGDADVDDVAQEVFVRLWKRFDTFQSDRRFTPWLYRITDNMCVDFLRKKQRGRMIHWQELAEIDPPCPFTHDPQTQLIEGERETEIWRAINKLPPRRAFIVFEHCCREMDFREIGERLGMPCPTVKWNYYVGIRYLRKLLEE